MDIKEAIEVLKDENRDICYGTSYMEDAIKTAIEALERTRWIPVSERLPDDSELVMLFAPAGTYTDFDWYDFGIYHKGSNSFLHIGFPLCAQFLPTSTHWMPLPEPPKEGHQ